MIKRRLTSMFGPYATPLGRLILERRISLGLTQEELARRAGMSHSAVSRLENGERVRPRTSTLTGLAAALGVSFDELMEHSGRASPRQEREPRTTGHYTGLEAALSRHPGLSSHDREIVLALVRALTDRSGSEEG